MISVCIPVGPFKGNKKWLKECIYSVKNQTLPPTDIIIINDGAFSNHKNWDDNLAFPHDNGEWDEVGLLRYCSSWEYLTMYSPPWRLGISHAFNFGVMLAPTECVFMLGSDDTLEPTCLEECWQCYLEHDKQDAYYSVTIKYMDTGELQAQACNAAMVTKSLWRKTGGFPIETALGGGDSVLLSIMLAHKLPGHSVSINQHLYNYRRHPDIHTFKLQKWFHIYDQIRGKLTEDWQPPEWSNNYS